MNHEQQLTLAESYAEFIRHAKNYGAASLKIIQKSVQIDKGTIYRDDDEENQNVVTIDCSHPEFSVKAIGQLIALTGAKKIAIPACDILRIEEPVKANKATEQKHIMRDMQ